MVDRAAARLATGMSRLRASPCKGDVHSVGIGSASGRPSDEPLHSTIDNYAHRMYPAALRPFYEGWANHQTLLIDALRDLSLEQLDLRSGCWRGDCTR